MVAMTTLGEIAVPPVRPVNRRAAAVRARALAAPLVAATAVAMTLVTIALHMHNGATELSGWWLGDVALTIALLFPGLLVAAKRPDNVIGWLLCVAALSTALTGAGREYLVYGFLGGTAPGWLWVGWFGDSLYAISMAALPLALMLFPDGHPASRRARWLLALPLMALLLSWSGSLFTADNGVDIGGRRLVSPAGHILPAGLPNAAMGIGTMLFFASLLASIGVLVVRFRSASDDTRLQMKWVAWAGALSAIELGTEVLPWNGIATTTGPVVTALLSASVCIAILRHQMFDIDLVINRTLVYGVLTVLVVGGYVLVVSLLGVALGQPARFGPELVATAAVAVAFSPVRHQVQRRIDRMLYGERRNPYGVMTQLGRRLEAEVNRGELSVVADAVTGALKLPYAAILDPSGTTLVETGRSHGSRSSVSLAYRGEPVGTLVVENRTPTARFTAPEQRLLADLARQAGAAVHAVRLSTDLQSSRRRLVTAKEEERRRLRRDLHDGLGPQLAAVGLQLDTARALIDDRPAETKALLSSVKADIRETIDDIRRLVYGLRPPALDELGLLGAIRDCASRFDSSTAGGLMVTVRAPADLPPLPAAVEVAAYLVVNEAVTNVVRHAGARRCRVEVGFESGQALTLTITDDGTSCQVDWRPGVGTASMAERAAELGGTLRIAVATPGRGTQVMARLPLMT